MADKRSIQDLNGDLLGGGIRLPADYVLMKDSMKKQLVETFLGDLGEGAVVVDLNAGPDGLYRLVDRRSVRYVALEQNRAIREKLEGEGVEALDWEIPRIPLDDSSADRVVSAPFIEHLPTYVDALNLLIEIRRVLKPGGKIVIVVPNYSTLGRVFFDDYKHSWVATRKRMIDMLGDCRLEVVGTRYTIGWITMSRGPLTALARLAIALVIACLRFHPVDRLLETLRLDRVANRFKKTFFELIVVEAKK